VTASGVSGRRQRLRTPLSRLPIRLRLAVGVAVVVLVILVVFGVAVGRLEAHRLKRDFSQQVYSNAQIALRGRGRGLGIVNGNVDPPVSTLVGDVGAVIEVFGVSGDPIAKSAAVNLGNPLDAPQQRDYNGYSVVTLPVNFFGGGGGAEGFVQYAQPLGYVNGEIGDLQLLLFLGALIGTVIAFAAGSLVARRAIAPIAELTAAAGEIERTRDPNRTLPEPVADDEVAELSRTLSGMLLSLSEARSETEATLARERTFVADASHELRTPLTSVLANLELLVDALHGDERESAESALRSTQRMRRLVGDLLLLARADAGQRSLTKTVDLADILIAATSELKPVSRRHSIHIDPQPAPIVGAPDELMRLTINLIDNAIRHTPSGTRITASTRALADGAVELVVADDGPGIEPMLREHMFERFVRGTGEVAGSSGLGLAIVATVAEAHAGTVDVSVPPDGGTRIVARLGIAGSGNPRTTAASVSPAARDTKSD
jgi:signal transduction histidine kinase